MQLSVHARDNRKRSVRQWRRRLWLGGSFALALILGMVIFLWRVPLGAKAESAREFIFDNPYFSVREIQVRGSDKVGGNEIIAMAGLKHGMNMWKIDPAVIEKKVAKHPWVRHALVRREFPHRVVIEVEERTPRAIVALGKLYYIDADGTAFKEVGAGENVNYPLLTGLKPGEVGSRDPAVRRRIQDAIRLGELMARDSHTVSEIHFEAPDRVVLYTTAFPMALQMGWGDWDGKLKKLDRILELWKGHEDRLASLDVRFHDQVVARLRRAVKK